MAERKVAILLSTFNGEKYLAEQIESLQKQTYRDWTLFIRDDGSIDQTHRIINDFCNADSRIHWINNSKQKNCGVKASFLKLLAYAKADFYMFCDQDDVWLPSKIEKTLATMAGSEFEPQLSFTDLKLVDSQLNPIGTGTVLQNVDVHHWITPESLFFDNVITGCTVMINEALKQIVLPVDPSKIVMHDWYFSMVASQIGKIHFLNQPVILYRQHQNNQVGINGGIISKLSKVKHFRKFKRQVLLQIQQGRISIGKTNYVPSQHTIDFLIIPKQSRSYLKAWIVFRSRFRKHTMPGTLALNIALLSLRRVGN